MEHKRQRRVSSEVSAVVRGMWGGCLFGLVALIILLVLVGPRAIGVVVALPILAIPVFLVEFLVVTTAPQYMVMRLWRPALVIVLAHVISVATWTLLWSATQYGEAWLGTLGILSLIHAVPAIFQALEVTRRLRSVRRVRR